MAAAAVLNLGAAPIGPNPPESLRGWECTVTVNFEPFAGHGNPEPEATAGGSGVRYHGKVERWDWAMVWDPDKNAVVQAHARVNDLINDPLGFNIAGNVPADDIDGQTIFHMAILYGSKSAERISHAEYGDNAAAWWVADDGSSAAINGGYSWTWGKP